MIYPLSYPSPLPLCWLSCLLFFYSRRPSCPASCKSGGTCPPCPMESAPQSVSTVFYGALSPALIILHIKHTCNTSTRILHDPCERKPCFGVVLSTVFPFHAWIGKGLSIKDFRKISAKIDPAPPCPLLSALAQPLLPPCRRPHLDSEYSTWPASIGIWVV